MDTQDGMFVGGTRAELDAAQDWLGYDLDFVSWTANRSNWKALLDSVDYSIGELKGFGGDVHWTIPLVTYDHTLEQAADHSLDGFYRQVARKLAATIPEGETLVVRTGEEFNGGWFGWHAGGREAEFAQAYRNFVDVFRSVSDRFRFEWNVGVTVSGTDMAKAYPGDAYVDYVGGDMYWDTSKSWSIQDPVKAFAWMRDHAVGLDWLADFAEGHGKPLAFSEWGINADSGWFIKLFEQWMGEHDVAYQSYWNSSSTFDGEFTNAHYSLVGRTYRELYGPQTSDAAAVPDMV